jgi:hypothetical protein
LSVTGCGGSGWRVGWGVGWWENVFDGVPHHLEHIMMSRLIRGTTQKRYVILSYSHRRPAPLTRSPALLVFPVYFSNLATLDTKSTTCRTTRGTLQLLLVPLPVRPSSDELVSATGKKVRTGEGVGVLRQRARASNCLYSHKPN